MGEGSQGNTYTVSKHYLSLIWGSMGSSSGAGMDTG